MTFRTAYRNLMNMSEKYIGGTLVMDGRAFGERYINTRPIVNQDIFGSLVLREEYYGGHQNKSEQVHRCVRIIKLR